MSGLREAADLINFQRDFVEELAKESDYGCSLDVSALFKAWVQHKHENILTYRDQSHKSRFTGKPTPVHHTPFMSALDDSMETYLKIKN